MTRKLKRFIAAGTAALLLTGTAAYAGRLGIPVAAADSNRLGFPDVSVSDWFANDVWKLTDAGIISGYPDGYFHPERELTNAEFIKLLVCAVGVDESGGNVRLYPEHWASGYITCAYERGMITDDDLVAGFDPDAPITRSAMTKMMILSLGIDTVRTDTPFTDTDDVYACAAYGEYLLRGYIQPDGSRICNGSGRAMRSEAAAIAVRVMEYRADPYAFKSNAVLENASANVLRTEQELIDLFCVLNREFMTEFTFRTSQTTRYIREYCERSNVINLEYFYNSYTNIDPLGDGYYRVRIEYLPDAATVRKYHSEAVEKADRIVAAVISPEMSLSDQVRALHDYLVKNCEYDYANYAAGTITQESRLAYGALVGGKAVCQGYCAAFALLCERAGIRCIVVGGNAPNSPDNHAWNVVLIDGEKYHIDVTHDDPVPDRKGSVSYRYFGLTDDEMTSYGYVWDKDCTAILYFY